MENIRSRDVAQVGLFVFDDLAGLATVIGKVYSSSMRQQCILYFQKKLNKHIRKADSVAFCQELKAVMNPDNPQYTQKQATDRLKPILLK